MRVAFVSFDFGEYCVRHANALCQLDDVDVQLLLSRKHAGNYADELDGRITCELFQRPRYRDLYGQQKSIRLLLRRIAAFKPDVVHFQGVHPWFSFCLSILRKRYPLVVTVHNLRPHVGDRSSQKVPQFAMTYGYRQANQIIVHGETLREELSQTLPISRDRIHVIPHIAMGALPNEQTPEDANMALFFGRIWEYKGLDYFIRAEPLVRKVIPNCRFVIAGKGDDFRRYKQLMTDGANFEVHNEHVPDEKRERLFAQAAVVVLPYIDGTQSGVVPIAFRHSKPVIATRVGALAEAVRDGHSGLLVPPRDETSLAQAIIKLLGDPQLRRRLGQQARQQLEQVSSDEVVARLHIAAYEAAISASNELQL